MKASRSVFARRLWTIAAFVAFGAMLWPTGSASAQGVTTGAITGIVTDAQHKPVESASVTAIHVPSGTTYEAVTRADGRFSIPGMRVGGPYTVTVFHGGTGALAFEPQTQENVQVNLGVATDLEFNVRPLVQEQVTVTATSDPIFSSERTGAATALSRDTLATLPTISNQLRDMTRLSPQSGGNMQFAGQDNRLNNITVDGSYFNNSFGLAGTPGERTGVAPISLSAIEQVQINVAPFDVRQGNFVGAGVNTVTRSGANQFRGSGYYQFRNENFVGTKAGPATVDPGTFNYKNGGGWVSGPIRRNKMFFFGNYEKEALTQPGTTMRANAGGQPIGGNIARPLASDLDALSLFLKSKFDYDTGPYQGYQFKTPATRALAKIDYNINDKNKVVARYNHLDSSTDVLVSNSGSLGFGNRRTPFTTGLNFANSDYQILENIRSIVGEWNSIIGQNMANNFITGYTHQDESRGYVGSMFPFVDVLDSSTVYTSFGFEPFTPNNELRYNTFQIQDNFTRFAANHSVTFGFSGERYVSENVFYPGSQSIYTYNSLADFYTDANGYLGNASRTVSPVSLRRFQVRWMNIPGMEKPLQPLRVTYIGGYAQDDWRVASNVKVTAGVRLDIPYFGDTGFQNADADALTFRDEAGNAAKYSTKKLPDPNVLWSPRLGFNWDISGDKRTQVRGGTGVFTGRPAYVWISNQIGNTGVLTGFEELNNTTSRPFNPDPNTYKPTNVTGAPASSYELALTNPDFKFPQLWRTNIAVDQRLPLGFTGTAELMYNRDVNGIYYINANLTGANSAFAGVDTRPRWIGNNRINSNIADAVVLKNENRGRSWNIATTLERTLMNGFWIKGAYSYGEAKNTVDPGSIAFGSWNGNPHAGDPNNPGLGFSTASPGNRFFVATSYTRQYVSWGATTVSAFWESTAGGNTSYTFSGDLNGDGGTGNDLIYIPRDTSETNFQTFTSGGRTYTAADQAQAWNAFIAQDPYLSQHRGQYALRNAVFLPMQHRVDLSVTQDFYVPIAGHRNSFQFRADVLNFGNLINHNWGTGWRMVTTQPLNVPTAAQGGPADAAGRAQYRLRTVNSELITHSFEHTAGISDVYRVQFSLRYTF